MDWAGGTRGLRPSYEMVALWAMPEFTIDDRSLPDIQRFKWSGHKPTGHPAEKPAALCRWIIESSNARVVLDPFNGSGSTGSRVLRSGASTPALN